MKDYQITRTVFATEDGTVTHDSGDGKNRVVFLQGHTVPQEEAERLKLPELDAAADAKDEEETKTNDPIAQLKPAVVATETKGAKSAKPATPQETK